MLKRFTRDRRGAAAVEFAFVAPIMILMYYGLSELTQGLMADRRAAHVASSVGDLVAQDTQITQGEVDDVFNVGKAIMAPFPSGSLSIRLTSVKADASGTPKVMWSKTTGTALSPLSGTVANFPTGLIAANESVVMSEVTYVYTSAIREVMPSGVTLTQKYYLKPRLASEVLWSNN